MALWQGGIGGGQAWPEQVIRDSVAALVQRGGYERVMTESLLGKVFRWLQRHFNDLMDLVRQIPHGPTLAKVCAVVILVLIAIRIVLAKRLRDEQARVRIARSRGGAHADAWSAAQALAAEGKYTDASHALYHAVLERLAAHEGLRLHRSKTSGDYARDLRRRNAPSHSAFRAFSRRYDEIIYGTGECSAEEYASLLALVQHLFVTARAA